MSKVQVQRLHSLTGHNDAIYNLQPSRDASKFFSAAGDGMVVLWDLLDPENGQLIARLPNSIYAIYYDQATDVLVAGHNYEGIHLLDWKNKKEVGSLQITKAAIFDIQRFQSGIIVGDGDGVLTLTSLDSLRVLHQVKASEKSVRTMVQNHKTGELAVGFSDNFIRVFDEKLGMKLEWQAHGNSVFTVRYTPDARFLISGSRDARLKVWDVASGYKQVEEVVAHMYAINHLDFSPDGKHFVTCSMDKSIKVWSTEEVKLLKVIDRARHAGHGTSVNKVLWTSHHDQLLSASDDRRISVWQIIF
ncbi:MAG TPA: WD40 repeat domain-containing protein [Chryseosolibacter sp.]